MDAEYTYGDDWKKCEQQSGNLGHHDPRAHN